MRLQRIRLIMWKEFLQLRRDPLLLRALDVLVGIAGITAAKAAHEGGFNRSANQRTRRLADQGVTVFYSQEAENLTRIELPDVVLISSAVSAAVPEYQAAERLGLEPQRCVVIEDSRPGVQAGVIQERLDLLVGQGLDRQADHQVVVLAAPAPELGDLGEVDVVLVVLGLLEGRGLCVAVPRLVADPGMALYNASKAFVHGLTRSIAVDHGSPFGNRFDIAHLIDQIVFNQHMARRQPVMYTVEDMDVLD